MDNNYKMPPEAFKNAPVQDSLRVGEGKAMAEKKDKITSEEIREAFSRLTSFKSGKAKLDDRIREEEEWWKIRHWDMVKRKNSSQDPQPASAWSFNAIINKHADLMDNIPKVTCLARESSDQKSAETIAKIFPIVLDNSQFEDVYSRHCWYYLKHGVSAYGCFWDNTVDNGLGDIRIKHIDLLNVFWEPGVIDIQDSSDLFIVSLVNTNKLKMQFPKFKDNIKSGNKEVVSKYLSDSDVDTSDKCLVVDWYYKTCDESGKNILHFCKFTGDCVLYATENEPEMSVKGWYDHGQYPIHLDIMYPVEGTCYGFGMIAVTKDPQLYIDRLDANIMKHSMMVSNPRFLYRKDSGINKDDFLDWSKALIEVDGSVDEERVRQINVSPLQAFIMNAKEMKINELKETAANRDVNAGGTVGSVTSGTAIATLQEAGNKVSRDLIKSSYRAFKQVCIQCVELMRQFYDEPRTFRIIGESGIEYTQFDNSGLKEQPIGDELFRVPIFDIGIIAEKRNPFSSMSQNETIFNLYNMGIFNPDNAQMAQIALEMIDMEGKDKLIEYVKQGATLSNMVQQLQAQIQQQNQIIAQMQGANANQNQNMQGSDVGQVQNQVSGQDINALRSMMQQ